MGIWRVRTSRFSRSRTDRPDWSGKPTSRMIALGMNFLASVKASSAVPATKDRKPISRDRSRRMAANVSSSSMTNKTRFASEGASRSSSTLQAVSVALGATLLSGKG